MPPRPFLKIGPSESNFESAMGSLQFKVYSTVVLAVTALLRYLNLDIYLDFHIIV